jgi:hypothetical protein
MQLSQIDLACKLPTAGPFHARVCLGAFASASAASANPTAAETHHRWIHQVEPQLAGGQRLHYQSRILKTSLVPVHVLCRCQPHQVCRSRLYVPCSIAWFQHIACLLPKRRLGGGLHCVCDCGLVARLLNLAHAVQETGLPRPKRYNIRW